MFRYISMTFFGVVSEFFAIIGSILFYILPLVIIFSIVYSYMSHNYIIPLFAPFIDALIGKISLFLSYVADEIARN